MDFSDPLFAVIVPLTGIGVGLFASPNRAGVRYSSADVEAPVAAPPSVRSGRRSGALTR